MSLHVEGPKVSWFTSHGDGREHAVRDESYALARNFGIDPETVCGGVLLPTSLVQRPGPRCDRCAGYVRVASTVTDQVLPHHRLVTSLWQALRRRFTHDPPGRFMPIPLGIPRRKDQGPTTVAPSSPPSGATVPV